MISKIILEGWEQYWAFPILDIAHRARYQGKEQFARPDLSIQIT